MEKIFTQTRDTAGDLKLVEMNYQQIYNQLIVKAQNRILEGYKEQHHIIPKCIGGNDNPDNLVYLTAREHFIAHKLLHFINPTHHGLTAAYWCMAIMKRNNREYHISSHEYERLKILFSKARKSFTHTAETKQKIGESHKLIWTHERRQEYSNRHKGKTHTAESKQKIREWNLGKIHSEETKQKMRKPMADATKQKLRELGLGKTFTPETIQKIREATLGIPKPKVTCIHCGLIGGVNNMKRYHFDNCKQRNNK